MGEIILFGSLLCFIFYIAKKQKDYKLHLFHELLKFGLAHTSPESLLKETELKDGNRMRFASEKTMTNYQ